MGGKVGVLVEVNCENGLRRSREEFSTLVKDIAMHIARPNLATFRRKRSPRGHRQEREIASAQARNESEER